LQIKNVSSHTADSKPVKQEVNGTVILPPLVFLVLAYSASSSWMRKKGFVTLTTGDKIMKLSFTFPSSFWQNSPGSFSLATHLDLIHDKNKKSYWPCLILHILI
jgi:hypothetical protein